jgi:lysophospholipase L1-like esterase
MKHSILVLLACLTLCCAKAEVVVPKVQVPQADKTLHSQWLGKTAAYLGDSMTDSTSTATACLYWVYLKELMGLKPIVYGHSGYKWSDMLGEAQKLKAEGGKCDVIFVFAGTNDFMADIPIGEFYTEREEITNKNSVPTALKHRTLIMDQSTFCGRINMAMQYLKDNFPDKQIIILTPIHRALANFGEGNVQPDENYANATGRYFSEYVETLRKASAMWAVPLIDLYTDSGLYPLSDAFMPYFHNKEMDRLHPNALGDYRIARTIQARLLTLPASW